MIAKLIIKSGPDKLDLVFALLGPVGPRSVTFDVEGELWTDEEKAYDTQQPMSQAHQERAHQHPYLVASNQSIGLNIDGLERTGVDECKIWGKVQGRVRGIQDHREDLPFRACFNTKTRRGTIEFFEPNLG